jgi:hypothetical protein
VARRALAIGQDSRTPACYHRLAHVAIPEVVMPEWLKPLAAFIVLAGFIGFAFWKSRGVRPDRGNTDNWQGYDPTNHTPP